jgi:hypothetical protein
MNAIVELPGTWNDLCGSLDAGSRCGWSWEVHASPFGARCVLVSASRPGASLCEEFEDLAAAHRWVARLVA